MILNFVKPYYYGPNNFINHLTVWFNIFTKSIHEQKRIYLRAC